MSKKKRIGILTSGGDCAGLNAVIRAVVHSATRKGYEVVGIEEGTIGLLEKPYRYRVITPRDFDTTVMRLGGTVLGTTNKGNPLHFPMPDGSFKDRSDEVVAALKEIGIEALIGIGGDGSMAILKEIVKKGDIKFVGIPKTIDNDVGMTEASVGFETAVYVATEALDRLQPTAQSHERVMILEVMGRDAGNIALAAGIAGGADVVLIPEIPYSFEKILEKIKEVKEQEGRNYTLMIVSEAIKCADGETIHQSGNNGMKRYGGVGHYVAEQIQERGGYETRTTVLGHVQRGASPIPYDRMIAAAFGVHAVELVVAGKFDRMVAWSNRQVIDVAIEDAIASYQDVDTDGTLVKTARSLGICFGD